MKRLVKWLFNLHDIEDLQTNATCGCCGKSHTAIVEKVWPYSVCKNCDCRVSIDLNLSEETA